MDRIMKPLALSAAASPRPCAVILPLHIWAIIFEAVAEEAQLHLTAYAQRPPFKVEAKLVNAKCLLTLCTTSRDAILKRMVLIVDVPDVTQVQQSVSSIFLNRIERTSTFMNSIQHVKRTLTIASNKSIQTYKALDVDSFPALTKLDVLVKYQARRNSDSPLQSDLSAEAMRADGDYKAVVLLAGGHFKRGGRQLVNAVDFNWAKYWKDPQSQTSIRTAEDGLGQPSIAFKEGLDIIISYELTYVIRLGEGYLPRYPRACGTSRTTDAPAKSVVVSWKTKFPSHEITEKKVVDQGVIGA